MRKLDVSFAPINKNKQGLQANGVLKHIKKTCAVLLFICVNNQQKN